MVEQPLDRRAPIGLVVVRQREFPGVRAKEIVRAVPVGPVGDQSRPDQVTERRRDLGAGPPGDAGDRRRTGVRPRMRTAGEEPARTG